MSVRTGIWIASIVTTGVLAIAGFRAFFYEPFQAPSGSMLPGLHRGDLFVVAKWGYGHYGTFGWTPFRRPITATLQRGDVVVFDYPKDPSIQYVKRLIGLPGDRVEYRGKKLSINGQPVEQRREEDYQHPERSTPTLLFTETLPAQAYGVLQYERMPARGVGGILRFPMSERCVAYEDGFACDVPAGHYFVLGDNRDDSEDSRYWGFVEARNIVGRVVYLLQ